MNRYLYVAAFLFAACFTNSPFASAQGGQDRFRAARWAHPHTLGDYHAQNRAMNQPWHGNFYYLPKGQPTALVVPPTVSMQQTYSWGVSQNYSMPLYHQFGRGAAAGNGGGQFMATPYWPSHTDQFGVYPVRAPW